ncbi:hypothetical protein AW736_03135 [Termitidicoccus mucosus]|uniref:Uncharacterized protein n=1 Tax=Termitidicoccus mucosus TaxID=1184151 RepID=A0A178IQG1_9BACT|nr:hypothetical protein AW736_03135 [Opitutaceae bacterium TSB47]
MKPARLTEMFRRCGAFAIAAQPARLLQPDPRIGLACRPGLRHIGKMFRSLNAHGFQCGQFRVNAFAVVRGVWRHEAGVFFIKFK